MTIVERPIADASDLTRIKRLSAAFPETTLHSVDLPYRLSSWALEDLDNSRLWLDADGRLLGWAILQTPFWTIDYAFHPDRQELHASILRWADERARTVAGTPYGRPAWFVPVFTTQTERFLELEAAGFRRQPETGDDAWTKVFLRRPGSEALPPAVVPEGVVIRSLAGPREAEAYVALHQAVFESKNMQVAWRQRTLAQPEYRRDLDLVAVRPDGQLAGFCIGWIDSERVRPAGQIEPLGVHADFREKGLGRALLGECIRRLTQAGANDIFVETDGYRDAAYALYTAMGFGLEQNVVMYSKASGDHAAA